MCASKNARQAAESGFNSQVILKDPPLRGSSVDMGVCLLGVQQKYWVLVDFSNKLFSLLNESTVLLDEILHDSRLGERGDISEVVSLIGSHFPQDATHYLARARFRQSSAKLDHIWQSVRSDFLANNRPQFGFSLAIGAYAIFQDDVSVDSLTNVS